MNKNIESIHNYLSEEGYRPKYDNDGDIIFKHEGDTYYITFKDDDKDFVSLRKYMGIEFNENQSLEIYQLLNKVNDDYIVGKCTIQGDQDKALKLTVDVLGSIEDFKNNFERYIRILEIMEQDLAEGFPD